MILRRRFSLLAVVWIFIATDVCLGQARIELSAQSKARNEAGCRSRLPAFAQGARTEDSHRALGIAAICPDTGADIIAREWSMKSRDVGYVRDLSSASKRLIDRRIANAAFDVLRDRALSWDLRFEALDALASQLSPTLSHRTGTQFVRVPSRRAEPPYDIVGYNIGTNDGYSMPNEFIAGREQLSDSERAAILAGI